MSLKSEIHDMVATQLGRHEVRAEDLLIEDLGAESADLVNLVAALEDRYQIDVGEEDAATLRSVADVESLVAERLDRRCAPEP